MKKRNRFSDICFFVLDEAGDTSKRKEKEGRKERKEGYCIIIPSIPVSLQLMSILN